MQESCHLLILKYLDCGQLLGYTRDLKFAVGSYVYEQLFKIFLGTAFWYDGKCQQQTVNHRKNP